MVTVPAAWSMLQRLWAPARGARERTAATALLLLLVVGAAPIAAARGTAHVTSPRTAQIAEIRAAHTTERPRIRNVGRVTASGLARLGPSRCCRSVANRELPPPRAPDPC